MNAFLLKIKEFLSYQLFKIGRFDLRVIEVVMLFAFIFFVWLLLRVIHRSLYKFGRFDKAKKYSIFTLLRYVIVTLAVIISLQILGINLSVLIAGSAALLVGLGLGMQHLFSDYISGIIILLDSSVKVGDIIEVNGTICRVEEIMLRTTHVITRDDKHIILPNTDLTRNELINWTLTAEAARFEVSVGVGYESDVPTVMRIMKEVADAQSGVLPEPQSFVRFQNFAESSIDFTVYFWVRDVFRVETIKSDIRVQLFAAFKSAGISHPFPQRVLWQK